jgi:uncharacterized membrane protein
MVGLRVLYFAFCSIFWIIGPLAFLISTLVVVVMLFWMDNMDVIPPSKPSVPRKDAEEVHVSTDVECPP